MIVKFFFLLPIATCIVQAQFQKQKDVKANSTCTCAGYLAKRAEMNCLNWESTCDEAKPSEDYTHFKNKCVRQNIYRQERRLGLIKLISNRKLNCYARYPSEKLFEMWANFKRSPSPKYLFGSRRSKVATSVNPVTNIDWRKNLTAVKNQGKTKLFVLHVN